MAYNKLIRIMLVVIISFLFIRIVPGDPARALVRVKTKTGKIIPLYTEYYALVIGVGDYRNNWPRLPNPVKDAREVADVLKTLGFQVTLVQDPTSRELKKHFNQLVEKGRAENLAVLVYYAGHGYTLEEIGGRPLGYIIPKDAADPETDLAEFIDSAISMRNIETYARLIRSKHVLMVFDSCFSGAIFSLVRDKPSPFIEELIDKPVRQFITAGNENEKVPDRSVFKDAFIQGIKQRYADKNSDGYITGRELGYYLQEQVVNYSNKGQHPQFGMINDMHLDKGDFVFHLGAVSTGGDEVKLPAAPEAPNDSGFDVSKYKQIDKDYRETKEKWSSVLAALKKNYNELLTLDKGDMPAKIKISAWKGFQGDTGVQQDNPYSTEDEDVRKKIAERIAHWEVEEERVSEDLRKQAARKPAEEQVEKSAQQKAVAQSGRVAGEVWKEPVTGMEFVWVDGGSFEMGDLFGEGKDCEKYIRKVRLDGFWLGKYEVTQGEWKKIMGNNPSLFKKRDNYPVDYVSWDDAQAFIGKLNSRKNGNYTFRLPSEAEWEYAAREGGRKVRFGNGRDIADPREINFDGSKDYKESYSVVGKYRKKVTPVGSFSPNKLGLCDMSGNVSELCEDIVGDYRKVGTDNPIYSGSGPGRINRGGNLEDGPGDVRASYRCYVTPADRYSYLGFRLARTP